MPVPRFLCVQIIYLPCSTHQPLAMRLLKTIIPLFALAVFTACDQTPQSSLAGRWSFARLDLPSPQIFLDSIKGYNQNDEEAIHGFLLDYKLVLRKDNTFDLVLFKTYVHGDWRYEPQGKVLTLKDDSKRFAPINIDVDSLTPTTLVARMKGSDVAKLVPPFSLNEKGMYYLMHQHHIEFYFNTDPTLYSDVTNDPYSKQNNTWRIPPAGKEAAGQIMERTVNHVAFCRLLMQNVVDGSTTYVSLHSFRTPLIISSADISLQHYSVIKDEWNVNFYDSAQAQLGYDLLEKAVVYNGVKPGTTGERFKDDVMMLDEVIDHLKKVKIVVK